jgi:ribosome-associated translation inhibitor RaiA
VTTPATTPVQVTTPRDLPQEVIEQARERMAELARVTDAPLLRARLTLRQPDTRPARARWTADAFVLLDGRPLAAHATGRDALQATDEVVDRLRRQIRRVIDAGAAQRNEPRVLERALAALPHEPRHRPEARRKPPELRDVIPQPTPYPLPEHTFDAVADLIDLDLEHLLFIHDRTGEDVVVHRRDDGRIGLLHPPGSPLADEDELVVPEPSRYPEPIPLDQARNEMDVLEHRFLYFIDRADGRGKVLYLRHDGDYGLVTPPSPQAAAAG